MHPTIHGYFPTSDDYFEYFKEDDTESCLKALNDLRNFVDVEGPFDGVIAFSQGASVAATLMLQRLQQDPARESIEPVFECAIFLGAVVPCDPAALEKGRIRAMLNESDGAAIHVPTTHIWGKQDPSPYPWRLANLCMQEKRNVYVHGGGHEIPGSQSEKAALRDSVRLIRRSISQAQFNR